MFKQVFPTLGGLICAVPLMVLPLAVQAAPGGWGSHSGGTNASAPAPSSDGGDQHRSHSYRNAPRGDRDGYRSSERGNYDRGRVERGHDDRNYGDRRFGDRHDGDRHDEGDRDFRRGERGGYKGPWGYAPSARWGRGPQGFGAAFAPVYAAFRPVYRGWGWAGAVPVLPRYPVYNGWGWARPVGPLPGYRHVGYRGGYRGDYRGWGRVDPYPNKPDRR